jgi:hypothetical protein
MFGLLGWCVALPLALASEALVVITALDLFADGQWQPYWFAAALLAAIGAVVAFFVGYLLRNPA